jgi:GntR family transcriptional repressor for pyruvate dehydrogenase complex
MDDGTENMTMQEPRLAPKRTVKNTGRVARGGSENLTRQVLADNVADAIVDLAGRERLRQGDALPPVTRLADQFKVSRAVVRDALEKLAAQGAISREQGRKWVLLTTAKRRNGKSATDGLDVGIPHRSLSDQAADAVLELILDQKLKEGEPLPPSAELADRLGVSLIVMREALASLAARGVLYRRQGRESVVALPDHELVGSILRVRASLEDIGIDEFQAARSALEAQAAGLAAAEPDLERRRAILEPLEAMRVAKNEKSFNENDLAFHMAIAGMSGNRAIELLLASLNAIVRMTVETSYKRVRRREGPAGIAQALKNHQKIADAIVAGDSAAAIAAMSRHFEFVNPNGATAADHLH